MDYPNVRLSAICPLCGQEKESGLIVCWPCYRKNDLRNGNSEIEIMIKRAEDELIIRRSVRLQD
jgi:hypothetical protein